MSLVNQNVEYRNLLGFPDYNGNAIHFLKSNDLPTGFKDVDTSYIREDLNIDSYVINNVNYIVRKADNLVTYENDVYTINNSENYPFEYVLEDGIIHSIIIPQEVIITTVTSTDWVKTFIFFDTTTETFIEKTSYEISSTLLPVAEIDIDTNNNVYINNYPTMANRKEETYKMSWKSSPTTHNKFPYSKTITNVENRTYEVLLQNKVSEYGYSIGEIAELSETPYIYLDDTFIGYLTDGSSLKIVDKTDYTVKEITLDNWNIIYKIW